MARSYADKVNSKLEEIWEKASEANPFASIALHESRPEIVRLYSQFAEADPDSAGNTAAILDSALFWLKQNSENELGTALERVREKVGVWDGDAARAFGEYLDSLETAFQYQSEYIISLKALIEMQGETAAAAQEAALEVADATLEALGAAAEARRQERRQAMANIVKTLAGTAAGAITGGPVGAVAGMVRGFGDIIAAEITRVEGDNPWDIIDDMKRKLRNVRTAIDDEERKLREGLDTLTGFLSGDKRMHMLPKDIQRDKTGDQSYRGYDENGFRLD